MAGLEKDGRVRHLASVVLTLLLAGAGSSFFGLSAIVATASVRQTGRAAPFHPYGAAAGLLALTLGVALWLLARRRLDALTRAHFAEWSLRDS